MIISVWIFLLKQASIGRESNSLARSAEAIDSSNRGFQVVSITLSLSRPLAAPSIPRPIYSFQLFCFWLSYLCSDLVLKRFPFVAASQETWLERRYWSWCVWTGWYPLFSRLIVFLIEFFFVLSEINAARIWLACSLFSPLGWYIERVLIMLMLSKFQYITLWAFESSFFGISSF